ncbi:MAG: NAD(P)/FAD-dependent oxidoreductase [Gammaproteobacteria bacterium]
MSEHDLRIVIIGAGMGGILSAIKLHAAHYANYAIYEKADSLGGTWRENTYPGLACDVPAHLYTYSFEPNPGWSRTFAPGPEIRSYFQHVADKHNVTPSIRFGEEVTRCEFVDGRWHLTTNKGTHDVADVVIAASGVLHHPNIPKFEGIESFRGACFHSSRWDHDVPLDGRRVGVIGTGSTAIQITSALTRRVKQFTLFQRTAQWVMPVKDPEYTAEERAAFEREPGRIQLLREELHRLMVDTLANAVIDADSPEMKAIEKTCRENLDTVQDPELRGKLTPTYRAACKRIIFSPDFYQAIQRPNAELVTESIRRIEPDGVRTADGRLHELDVLVLATGFRPDQFIRPTLVRGRGGIDLDDVWADRPQAYMSLAIPHFPNFFMVNGPNGPVGNFSLIQIAEFQLGYILQLMERLRKGECREISARQAALEKFDQDRIEASKKTIWATGCNSWYLDKDGVPMSWPWSYARFAEAMQHPDFDAYELVA